MKKSTIVLIGFIILKFLLQYILISPEYDLQRDEYLHLDQAHHLAWGYLSVPPVTSWISYIIITLGNTVFWIKFFPALFGALTMLIVWKTIEELGGDLFALITGATCVLFSVILALNTLYQPNSLDVLSWTAFYFCVIKYINSEKQKWLFVGAIVFALGFLNKYNIVFLLLGLFPAILITPQRKLLAQKQFYVAALTGLLLILPNLLWQFNNNFPVIHHLKELSDYQLVNVDRWGFLRSQLIFFIGAFVVIIGGLYALLCYKPFRKYKLFFWSMIFTLSIFIYFRAKDYYAIGVYPIYMAFGAVFLSNVLASDWKRYLRPVVVIIPLLFFIPMYQVAFPNKSPEYILENQQAYKKLGRLHWEDGKDHAIPQDFADMLGWKELAYKVDSLYAGLSTPNNTLVLCDNYGQAGAINYYSKKGIKAVSFNADYINWFVLDERFTNLIRVKDYDEKGNELKETSPYFLTSIAADSITNRFAREYGTTIFVFTGARVDIIPKIKKEIAKMKSYR
ncbi:MAG: glycosyltransferase family 39 protein [Chitinophaga sp.]|uniref:ArnT family glycosyltransferase n=1 Tax=Chitinophaga sp. TaxID=1869181 RepID=UPI0025C0E1D6|nr:glycosyltransferase family 39 protein [Chitinophaga sp.]MBV8251409.1 glycosyltransferase family 39 protein [Chitinophaga sp.]